MAELLGILRPDTDDDPVFILAQATPGTRNASKAHAHLQKKYGISVTLGGSREK
ncbi:MAG: hypothetical protein MK293_01300 [Pedosphaera sp.]|nr:hypothetical protein [Pedosphaera sp.]